MTYRIAYGRDTGSLEDHTQLVLLDLPDECSDMESEDLEHWIKHNWPYADIKGQDMVGYNDVIESLTLILEQEVPTAAKTILTSLNDAFTNNDD